MQKTLHTYVQMSKTTSRRRLRTRSMGDFHEAAFQHIPVHLVGHNPDLPGVEAAADWQTLKGILRRHRVYVHTADPLLEDGYDTATLDPPACVPHTHTLPATVPPRSHADLGRGRSVKAHYCVPLPSFRAGLATRLCGFERRAIRGGSIDGRR